MTARVQENRTATPNTPPPNGSLGAGELYVEMADPLRLWTGVPVSVAASGVRLIFDAQVQAAANAGAVQKTGDTMTGPLVLSGPPTAPSQAANKAYVDSAAPGLAPVQSVAGKTGIVTLVHTDITDWTTALTPLFVPYAPLASPTFTGDPKAPTPAPGDNDTSVATTAFVNQAIIGTPKLTVSDTAPASPTTSMLWWDSLGGQLYLWYNDGNSTQWVPASNVSGLADAPNDGALYGRRSQQWVSVDAAIASSQAYDNTGRNKLHNPLFNVQQRGVGPWASGYTADRWVAGGVTDSISYSIGAFADAHRAAIGDEEANWYLFNSFAGSSAAGACNYLVQRIENVRRLAGKTVTVSFWANCQTGALKLGVNASQIFGTGGSPSASVRVLATGAAVQLSPTLARYQVTIPIPSIAGKTLGTNHDDYTQLELWYSASSTVNAQAGNIGVQAGGISLWGVQLEIGPTATPLEKPDPRYDVANCLRFYQIGQVYLNGNAPLANASFGVQVPFNQFMRAPPTVAFTAPVYTNASGIVTAQIYAGGFIAGATATIAGGCTFNSGFTASADL